MRRRRTLREFRGTGFKVALLCLVSACDVGHADYALDLAVRLRIVSQAGAPVARAVVRLSDDGQPVEGSLPICISNEAGLCEGQRSYRFGKTVFRSSSERLGRRSGLALTIVAAGYDVAAIRLSELSREEVAGIRAIKRDVVLLRTK